MVASLQHFTCTNTGSDMEDDLMAASDVGTRFWEWRQIQLNSSSCELEKQREVCELFWVMNEALSVIYNISWEHMSVFYAFKRTKSKAELL